MASINATTSSGIVATADNTGTLQLQTAGTNALNIDASQNVGIGTTSPFSAAGYKSLTINGSTSGLLALQNNGTNQIYLYSDGSAFNFKGLQNIPLDFYTNDTYRMRIDSSGNVLVGTTSNASSAAKIMVSSTAPQMAVDGNGAGVNSLINWTTSGTTKAQTFFDATNTRFYIACNNSGGVYLASGGTSWTSASDERVKDIIEPIENATEKLGSWRAVIGKYKTDADGTRRSFLIAQDVIQTFPEAVDATNEEELGVSYTDIIPVLVKAIQEQQTIINDLKARIETLENK